MQSYAPPPSAPAYGDADRDNDGFNTGGGGGEKTEAQGQQEDHDGDQDSDEAPDDPPPMRGLVSSQRISHSKGSGGSFSGTAEEEAEGPRWEPNMELDLGDFDQSSVTYLAEASMCGLWTCGSALSVLLGP